MENEGYSDAFLEWLRGWRADLKPVSLADVVRDAGSAEKLAVLCVDLTEGFARKGALSSPRVEGIVPSIRGLFERAYAAGVRQFLLPQDQHPEGSPEFESWPAHSLAGTEEAQTVAELVDLPFSDLFHIIPKCSISCSIGTSLEHLLEEIDPTMAICVGDCTDLCVYQMAMHVRLRANAAGQKMRVIVPEDCVQTYDMPVSTAMEVGALPHPGDFLHDIFLYHMALNGIEVVGTITD